MKTGARTHLENLNTAFNNASIAVHTGKTVKGEKVANVKAEMAAGAKEMKSMVDRLDKDGALYKGQGAHMKTDLDHMVKAAGENGHDQKWNDAQHAMVVELRQLFNHVK